MTPAAPGAPGGGPAPAVPAWLARAEPAPPPALAARLAALVGAAPAGEAAEVGAAADADAVGRCVDGAERVVAGLLRDGCTARDSALDLLAADALATYAFELAADRPESLAAVADAAMVRFAALGLTPPGAGDGAAAAPGAPGPSAAA